MGDLLRVDWFWGWWVAGTLMMLVLWVGGIALILWLLGAPPGRRPDVKP